MIDTTGLNVHQLTDKVARAFGTDQTTSLKATIVSFGFKYGIPVDADLVADMRFLPNPHWVPDLRPLSGRDDAVASYVLEPRRRPGVPRPVPPRPPDVARGYLVEGKRFMTVAIGCTGGKHRSVAMTEEIARRLSAAGIDTRAEPPRPGTGVTVARRRRRHARPAGGGPGWGPRPRCLAGRPASRRRPT